MPLAKRRVLSVDDDEDALIMLTHLLDGEGSYVITVESVELALELAERCSFDLLVQ